MLHGLTVHSCTRLLSLLQTQLEKSVEVMDIVKAIPEDVEELEKTLQVCMSQQPAHRVYSSWPFVAHEEGTPTSKNVNTNIFRVHPLALGGLQFSACHFCIWTMNIIVDFLPLLSVTMHCVVHNFSFLNLLLAPFETIGSMVAIAFTPPPPLQEIYGTVGYIPVHLEKMASRSSHTLASASSSKFGRASPARAPSRLQPSPLVRHHKLTHAHSTPKHEPNKG